MTRNRSLAIASLACLLATAAITQTPAAAHATSMKIDVAKLSAHMASLGITEPVRDELVAQLVHGRAVDSMTGTSPVSSVSRDLDGFSVTTTTYADGSMDERGFEIGRDATPQELKTMVDAASLVSSTTDTSRASTADDLKASLVSTGITSCTRGSNAGVAYAQGCHIYYNGISASNSFDANYQLYRGGSKAQYIDGTAKFVSFVETVSNEQVNTYDDGSRIRYSFDTSFNGIGSVPGYLQLKVSPSGAVVTAG